MSVAEREPGGDAPQESLSAVHRGENDNREVVSFKLAHIGIGARLLAGGQFLNPENPIRPQEVGNLIVEFDSVDEKAKSEFIGHLRETSTIIADASNKERKEFYEQTLIIKGEDKDIEIHLAELSYDKHMELWKTSFTTFLNDKTESLKNNEDQQSEWLDLCDSFGIKFDQESGKFTSKHAQTFYNEYLNDSDKKDGEEQSISAIDKFIKDGVCSYFDINQDKKTIKLKHEITQEEKEAIEQKRKWVEEIGQRSFGEVSGAVTSMLIEAEAIYNDKKTRKLFKNLPEAVDIDNTDDKKLLAGLWALSEDARKKREGQLPEGTVHTDNGSYQPEGTEGTGEKAANAETNNGPEADEGEKVAATEAQFGDNARAPAPVRAAANGSEDGNGHKIGAKTLFIQTFQAAREFFSSKGNKASPAPIPVGQRAESSDDEA